MVGVRRFKLNTELARYLREQPLQPLAHGQPVPPAPSLPSYHAARWRVRDRLGEAGVAELVAAFKAGTPKHILAERYGLNLRSVKRLLRTEGVKRQSRYDVQA